MKIDLSKSKAKIEELKNAVAAIDIPLEIDVDVDVDDDKVSREELDARIDSIWRSIWDLYDEMYKSIMSVRNDLWEYAARHGEGHLPKIPGSEKMQEILDILKLNNEYKVAEKYVFASDTGKKKKQIVTIEKEIE